MRRSPPPRRRNPKRTSRLPYVLWDWNGTLLTRLPARTTVQGVVLIGDALHDREVADALGIGCVLCATGGHSAARLRAAAPTEETLLAALVRAERLFGLERQSPPTKGPGLV